MKYVEMSKQVLDLVGGIQNVKFVEHCATRLRIHYFKKSLVDIEAIKKVESVVGVVDKTGQIQIIIGPNVHESYTDFLDVSGFVPNGGETEEQDEEPEKKNFMYYVTKFGNFSAAVFMPIVPALITGGIILALKNLLVNYIGFGVDSGTAKILLAIFDAGFSMLPVWIGYNLANKLKMEPIMGAFLGAVLCSAQISGVEGLDFFGISIPAVGYTGSVLPVVLGVIVMSWIYKLLTKYVPDMFIFFVRPLLTMIITVPITLIILGPIGTMLSGFVGDVITGMMSVAGGIATPILSALYPYMVMLGLDKAMTPIMVQSISEIGYDPIIMVMGLISNLCIGGTALAVATTLKEKGQKGMIASFGVTALCGVTEPAFYGALIMRPKCLIGTAIGAVVAGLVAGFAGLQNYVVGGCPGLLSALFFLPENGSMGNFILYLVVCALAIVVSFVATKIILKKGQKVVENL